MITFKNLTMKNFLSVGAVTQTVNLNDTGITLVMGENLDLGGNGSKNGCGKTTLFNALSYALFGQAISNIKRDNLINTVNKKNMVVSVEFEKSGILYRIERGRKPHFFKYQVGDNLVNQASSDEAQGENKETQKEIDTVLGLTHTMFKHIMCMNTYTEPFLQMGAAKQREIIEELMGITLLSQKAENLKELIKCTKSQIEQEEFQIHTIRNSNQRIQVAIQDLQNRIQKWDQNHANQVQELRTAIQALSDLDIHTEIDAHKHNTQVHQLKHQATQVRKDCVRVTNLHVQLTQAQHNLCTQYAQAQSHACPMCDQPMHAQKQLEIKTELESQIAAQDEQIQALLPELHTLQEQDRTLQQSIMDNPLIPTVYDSLEQAVDHRNSLQQLEKELTKLQSEINPYSDQTATLESTLQEISYAELNELQTLKEHQEFLLRLLINKDSFIRKKIIDQNLTYLNHRLTDYLNTLGISHDVKFLNDLSVEINYMAQDMDFAQLSRGESTRVILALSWAFRDIWENQNTSMNFLGVDELIDVGLDQAGVDKSMEVLKMFSRDRHKHVLLISHRDELLQKCDRVIAVIKEGGFTRLQSDWDI